VLVKEVEPVKHITQTLHISKKTPRSHPNYLGNQPLRPTKFLMHQTPGGSLDMDQGSSRKLQKLPQQGKGSIWGLFSPVIKQYNTHINTRRNNIIVMMQNPNPGWDYHVPPDHRMDEPNLSLSIHPRAIFQA